MTSVNIDFFVGKIDGGYLAATNKEPYLCIEGATVDEAIEGALDAFHFYLGTANRPQVTQRTEVQNIQRSFVPAFMIHAQAG